MSKWTKRVFIYFRMVSYLNVLFYSRKSPRDKEFISLTLRTMFFSLVELVSFCWTSQCHFEDFLLFQVIKFSLRHSPVTNVMMLFCLFKGFLWQGKTKKSWQWVGTKSDKHHTTIQRFHLNIFGQSLSRWSLSTNTAITCRTLERWSHGSLQLKVGHRLKMNERRLEPRSIESLWTLFQCL